MVEKYKQEKEAEFKKKAESTGLSAENASLEAATAADIAQMKITFEKNKALVPKKYNNYYSMGPSAFMSTQFKLCSFIFKNAKPNDHIVF